MQFIQYNKQKTLLFISGMFAGGWIWNRSHKHITHSQHLMMEEPLCAISHSVEEITQQLATHLQQLATPLTLVGNSLGSLIALKLAQQLPNQVEQVLISGSAGFSDVNLNIRLSRHEAQQISQTLGKRICYDSSVNCEKDIAKVGESFGKHLRNIVGLIRDSHRINGEEVLQHIHCPINAIWGDCDAITPLEGVQDVFERYNIPCTVLKQCGHSPMYEQPQAFAAWVNQCMAKLDMTMTHKKVA